MKSLQFGYKIFKGNIYSVVNKQLFSLHSAFSNSSSKVIEKAVWSKSFTLALYLSLLLQIKMGFFTFVKLMMTLVDLLIFVSMLPLQFHVYIELEGAVKVLIFTDSVKSWHEKIAWRCVISSEAVSTSQTNETSNDAPRPAFSPVCSNFHLISFQGSNFACWVCPI